MLYSSAVPVGQRWERALDGATLDIVETDGVPLRRVPNVGDVPCWLTALLLLPRWEYDLLLDISVDESGQPALVGLRSEPFGEEKLEAFRLVGRWPDGEYPQGSPEEQRRIAVRSGWTPLPQVLGEFPMTVLDGLLQVAIAKAAHHLVLQKNPQLRHTLPTLDQELLAALGARVRPRRRRDPITSPKLEEAARVYRTNVQRGNPTEAVAKAMHVGRSQASRYIRQARERGYLGPARRNTAGEAEQE